VSSDRVNYNLPIVERHDWVALLPQFVQDTGARCFEMYKCRIIVSHEPENGWHLSISRTDRDPSWDDIVTARYRLLPDVYNMAMFLPKAEDYVNIHPHTFHLYEVKDSRIVLA
jgi:hypothetical protein